MIKLVTTLIREKTKVLQASVLSTILIVGLVNCSAKAVRVSEAAAPDYSTLKFKSDIKLSTADQAKEEMAVGVFRDDVFLTLLKSEMEKEGLISAGSKETIELEIVDARFRGEGVAIWLGTMAGHDAITMLVTVKDAKGVTLDQHKLRVTYALGGFGGGPNATRADYFYKKLTELTIKQLKAKT